MYAYSIIPPHGVADPKELRPTRGLDHVGDDGRHVVVDVVVHRPVGLAGVERGAGDGGRQVGPARGDDAL
ncbi:hypothetical protein MYX19_01870 [Nitrospinae bacterium AH-259-F20]|nr:hypothetical protein [Nitrospinae bacterium AH-259-F20]